jgi:hypothetical protein
MEVGENAEFKAGREGEIYYRRRLVRIETPSRLIGNSKLLINSLIVSAKIAVYPVWPNSMAHSRRNVILSSADNIGSSGSPSSLA